MGWLLFPSISFASNDITQNMAYASLSSEIKTNISNLELQLSAAKNQLNIDTQTVISDSATLVQAQSDLTSAQYNYDNNLIIETSTSGSGIHVDIYNQTYTRTRAPNGTLCRSDTFTAMANNWGGGSVAGCNSDYVTIHYYGSITPPVTDTYRFKNIADDGFYMTLNNQVVIDEWRDKGCNGNWGAAVTLQAGVSYSFDAWFYEWGGGACSTLYYQSSTNWAQVPSSWFTTITTTSHKDPALYTIVQQKQQIVDSATAKYNSSVQKVNDDYSNISKIESDIQSQKDRLNAIPPYLNPPTNLQVNVDTSTATVHLTWNIPETSNASVLTYAISWSTSNFTSDGWGWTHDQTNVDIPFDIFRNSSGWGKNIQFRIRADNNTLSVYSDNSISVESFIPDPTPPSIPIQIPDTNTVVETHTVMETQTATETQTVSETSTTAVDTSTLQTPIDSQTVQETATVTETPTAQSPIDPQPSVPAIPPSDPSPPVQPIPQPPVEINPRPVPTQPIVDPIPAPEPTPVPVPVEETPVPNLEPDPTPVADIPQDPAIPQVNPDNNDPSQVLDSTDVPTKEPTPVEPDQQTPTNSQDSQTSDTVTQPTQEPLPTDDSSSNNTTSDPNNLPEDKPLLPPAEKLVPHVQVDKPGVTNGGIEFFGTKSQPQVIGEDGKLTPPPPPPGSGLPIPPDAITTADTFIGQPGGTTFNAPDIAVPVVLTPLTGAVASIPGAEALNQAFVALANIGNDMSPITRKKAKKILVITALVSQVAAVRRKFG